MSGRLLALHRDHGQSPWIDNLQRRHLSDGTLAALIDRGVRGLTSNPTIFQKAITGSSDYDEQFSALTQAGMTPRDAYWRLVEDDITRAADLFAPLHRDSRGGDGFVSVEVDPSLARDTDATLVAARDLAGRIGRPNVMIKVPATREGLAVVRSLTAEGISVNVTLIFSVERHIQVMEAYIDGIEDAVGRGIDPSRIAGVASFFISRVDAAIDPVLEQAGPTAAHLVGRSAINQARLARAASLRMFSGDRWSRLAELGARAQRPLWASTSTKNPSYPDTLYVDELIGAGTVNTLPENTLDAFDDHGTVTSTLDADPERAHAEWAALKGLGVDSAIVAEHLEREGVRSFVDSFEALIADLSAKAGR